MPSRNRFSNVTKALRDDQLPGNSRGRGLSSIFDVEGVENEESASSALGSI
jgi:hypothetical protein